MDITENLINTPVKYPCTIWGPSGVAGVIRRIRFNTPDEYEEDYFSEDEKDCSNEHHQSC